MWVRGLKLICRTMLQRAKYVAPHVGAWIETVSRVKLGLYEQRRTPCGCVD